MDDWRKKLIKRIVLSIITAICSASILLGAILFHYKAIIFRINGEPVKLCSVKELATEIEEKVLEKYKSVEGINSYLVIEPDLTPITACNILQYFTMRDVIINSEVTITDKEALTAHIEELNKGRSKSTPCKIVFEGNSYAVQKGTPSSQIDPKKVIDIIESGGSLEQESILIDDNDYKLKRKLVDQANNLLHYRLRYKECSFSPQPEELIFSKASVSIDVDQFVQRVLDDLKDSYNSVGSSMQFRNHSGELVEVSGGTWGREIDTEKETDAIKEYVKKLDNRLHTPNFNLDCGDIGNTFVEVSIEEQHVWLVKNGTLARDSKCVTGRAGVHDTPKGVYYIMEKMNGKTLRGTGYSTWVNKWMRLTYSGIGLHDASWRSNFGGEIYKTNGSHGCINLPSDFAAYLLDEVKTGMPVIIY